VSTQAAPVPELDGRPACPTCKGSGEIGFNPTWNNDPQWDDSRPCYECGGTGDLHLEDLDPADEPYLPACGDRDCAGRCRACSNQAREDDMLARAGL